MAYTKIKNWLEKEITNIHESGLYKKENILTSSQSTNVDTTDGEKINFCANNLIYSTFCLDKPEFFRTAVLALFILLGLNPLIFDFSFFNTLEAAATDIC